MSISSSAPHQSFGACTIAARNYLPQARVLASSLARHHPGLPFTLLLVDDEERLIADADEAFRIWRLADIGLDRIEIGRLAGYYGLTELATAVKPRLLGALIAETDRPVIYLDPDIKVFDRLDEAVGLASHRGIVLTPHTTSPFPRDDRFLDEYALLGAGMYNLGFIGVGPGRQDFLDWWWVRTRRDAFVDPARMRFTDQRWIDFVPSFFEHAILKDPGYNVAYWNLHARQVSWTGAEYRVNDRPLRFFHFSGYDMTRPHVLSRHQGDRPRVLLSEHPGVARLCREYAADVRASTTTAAHVYGWESLANGLRFDRRMQALFREAMVDAEQRGIEPPPGPFDSGGPEPFLAWLAAPIGGGLPPQISRYLYRVFTERGDVAQAFPALHDGSAAGFLEWVLQFGAREERIPAALWPRSFPDTSIAVEPRDVAAAEGVNIVGYSEAASGVGEVARLLDALARRAGVSAALAPAGESLWESVQESDARYDVNLLCVNADQTPAVARRLGRAFFRGRPTAGVWFWEVAWPPPGLGAAFDAVDEVWVASEHVASAIRPVATKPVSVVRLPVVCPDVDAAIPRSRLGVPPGPFLLFMFDFLSVFDRKNPIGVIDAFSRAFAPGQGPALVIKSINGDARLLDLERLREAAAARPDVHLIDRVLLPDARAALVALCDGYVSLHRAEGFGLTMAEAMCLGKPVIATGYSGNLTFMTPQNSLLVDYTMTSVPEGCAPYPEGAPWADPDLGHAASLIRRLYDEPDEAAAIGAHAAEDMRANFSLDACAPGLAASIDALRQRARRSPDGDSPGQGRRP